MPMVQCPVCGAQLDGLARLAMHTRDAHGFQVVEWRTLPDGVTFFNCFCGRGEMINLDEAKMLEHYAIKGGLQAHLLAHLLKMDADPSRPSAFELKVESSPDLPDMTAQQIYDAVTKEGDEFEADLIENFLRKNPL